MRRVDGDIGSLEQLTTRQREILQLVAEGKTTKEIARILRVKIKTVETHRSDLMDWLDIHDIAGLVKYAVFQSSSQILPISLLGTGYRKPRFLHL